MHSLQRIWWEQNTALNFVAKSSGELHSVFTDYWTTFHVTIVNNSRWSYCHIQTECYITTQTLHRIHLEDGYNRKLDILFCLHFNNVVHNLLNSTFNRDLCCPHFQQLLRIENWNIAVEEVGFLHVYYTSSPNVAFTVPIQVHENWDLNHQKVGAKLLLLFLTTKRWKLSFWFWEEACLRLEVSFLHTIAIALFYILLVFQICLQHVKLARTLVFFILNLSIFTILTNQICTGR